MACASLTQLIFINHRWTPIGRMLTKFQPTQVREHSREFILPAASLVTVLHCRPGQLLEERLQARIELEAPIQVFFGFTVFVLIKQRNGAVSVGFAVLRVDLYGDIERERQILALLEEALELDGDEQSAYLASACASGSQTRVTISN